MKKIIIPAVVAFCILTVYMKSKTPTRSPSSSSDEIYLSVGDSKNVEGVTVYCCEDRTYTCSCNKADNDRELRELMGQATVKAANYRDALNKANEACLKKYEATGKYASANNCES